MSRSEMRPAAKSLFGSRDSLISSLFGPGRKKEAFERLLRSIGAFGPAARHLCSSRSRKRHAACLGLRPALLPNRTKRRTPAATPTPSRESAFFLLCFAGLRLVYELHRAVTRKFSGAVRPREMGAPRGKSYFSGKGC